MLIHFAADKPTKPKAVAPKPAKPASLTDRSLTPASLTDAPVSNAPKFNKVAYQRDYMRKRREKAKA